MKNTITLFSVVPLLLLSSPNPAGCSDPFWVKVEPASSPPKRAYHAMAYDAESDRVILFSGDSGPMAHELYSDTWAYDHNSSQWTNLNPPISPPVTAGHAMSYDIESDRIILFASSPGDSFYAIGTWAFDFNSNSWTDLNPTQKPRGRFGNNMAYDAESDRIILFGGFIFGPTVTDDTWSYDFNTNTWTEMNPPTSPPARSYHSMVYDSESDRIILFGGGGALPRTWVYNIIYDDTWAYDFNTDTWTEMMPDTHPSARVYTDMTYNGEECDRVVLFGGGTGSFTELNPNIQGHGNETWMYDYNSNTWELVSDQGPTYRRKHKLAYDSESDCVILFGGDTWDVQGETTDYQNETWGIGMILDPLIGGKPVNGYEGWYLSEWFGTYYTDLAPWLYHSGHGFFYHDSGSTNQSMYVYDHAMGAWWWTSETVYPSIYAYDPPADNTGTDIESEWLWYFEETKTPRTFGVVTGSNAGQVLFFGP